MFTDRYSAGQQFLRPDALPRTDGVLVRLARSDASVNLMYYPDELRPGGVVGPYVSDKDYVKLCYRAKPEISDEDWARVLLHMPVVAPE